MNSVWVVQQEWHELLITVQAYYKVTNTIKLQSLYIRVRLRNLKTEQESSFNKYVSCCHVTVGEVGYSPGINSLIDANGEVLFYSTSA